MRAVSPAQTADRGSYAVAAQRLGVWASGRRWLAGRYCDQVIKALAIRKPFPPSRSFTKQLSLPNHDENIPFRIERDRKYRQVRTANMIVPKATRTKSQYANTLLAAFATRAVAVRSN